MKRYKMLYSLTLTLALIDENINNKVNRLK